VTCSNGIPVRLPKTHTKPPSIFVNAFATSARRLRFPLCAPLRYTMLCPACLALAGAWMGRKSA
jgi:hypothetical protein